MIDCLIDSKSPRSIFIISHHMLMIEILMYACELIAVNLCDLLCDGEFNTEIIISRYPSKDYQLLSIINRD